MMGADFVTPEVRTPSTSSRHWRSSSAGEPQGRVRYRRADRAILAAVSPLLPRCRWRFFLVTPETLLRWHREMSKGKWRRWRGPSHPPLPDGVVELILRLGRENRSWGCVRIQRELRGIGF